MVLTTQAEGKGLEPSTGKPAPDFESGRNSPKPEENVDFAKGAASGAAVERVGGVSDPNLAVIVERWDSLPEAVRAGIVAMVKATGRT